MFHFKKKVLAFQDPIKKMPWMEKRETRQMRERNGIQRDGEGVGCVYGRIWRRPKPETEAFRAPWRFRHSASKSPLYGWSTKRLWSLDRSGAIGNVAREDVKDRRAGTCATQVPVKKQLVIIVHRFLGYHKIPKRRQGGKYLKKLKHVYKTNRCKSLGK